MIKLNVLAQDLQTQVAAQQCPLRSGHEGSVQQLRDPHAGSVKPSIQGTSPSTGQRRARDIYTLNCEEPAKSPPKSARRSATGTSAQALRFSKATPASRATVRLCGHPS